MGFLPRQIAWTEPWSVEYVKGQLRQCRKEMSAITSPWRIAVFCVVLPTIVMSVVKAFLPTLEWGVVLRVVLHGALLGAAIMVMQFFMSIFPTCIHILASGVSFRVGNACSHIDMKNITALSFETHDGKRCFVVHATSPKGPPYERRALLPTKGVTEQDIIAFLYEMNLGRLVKDTRELAEV